MSNIRLGSFKPNWIGLCLTVTFVIFFIIYIVGYKQFDAAYRALYDNDDYKAITNMKWFLVGCPIVMLITTVVLFIASSFESRQILLGFSVLLFLGGLGFVLISVWLGANIVHFNSEKGWESCTDTALCNKLKAGLDTFIVGAVFCALGCFGDIGFCFVRARQIQANEASYVGLQTDEVDPTSGLEEQEMYFQNGQPEEDGEEEELELDV